VGAPALMTGNGFMVMTTEAVFWQPFPSVPITVYAVVVGGVAEGDVQEIHDSPVVGDQV